MTHKPNVTDNTLLQPGQNVLLLWKNVFMLKWHHGWYWKMWLTHRLTDWPWPAISRVAVPTKNIIKSAIQSVLVSVDIPEKIRLIEPLKVWNNYEFRNTFYCIDKCDKPI